MLYHDVIGIRAFIKEKLKSKKKQVFRKLDSAGITINSNECEFTCEKKKKKNIPMI